MNEVYSGYEIELNKEEDKAYKAKILKIEGNSYQETRDEVAGTTVSGDFISISDAQDLPITKFNIEGKSVQETREGYNLVDFSIGGALVNDILTISGDTAYKSYTYNITNVYKNNPNKTLYFSYESIDLSNAKIGMVQLIINKTDGTTTYNSLMDKNGKLIPYTIPSDTSDISKVTLGVYANNSSTSGITYTIVITKPMLAFEENLPYEQYGASPSIEYEAPIESVGDNINLIDIDSLVEGYVKDGGECSTSTQYGEMRSDFLKVKPNTQYTFKIHETSGKEVSWIGIAEYSSSEISSYILRNVYSPNKYIENASYTITTSNTTQYVIVSARNLIGATKIKFEEGQATPYSPYGQGSVEVKNVNKNILKLYDIAETTKNGLTYSCINGKIKINGTATALTNIWFNDLDIKMNVGEYTLSSNTNLQGKGSVALKDLNGNIVQTNLNAHAKITLNKNTTATQFLLQISSGATFTNFEMEIQLEKGSTATDYVPHQSQTKALYTQQPFRAIGDVKDRFVKKMGKWYEEHFVYEKILDENETIGYSAEQGEYTIFQIHVGTVLGTNVKSSKLPAKHNWGSNFNFESIWTGGATNSSLQIKILTSRLSEFSTTAIKTWLSENNMTVIYALETPTLIPCTPEQVEVLESMRTYEGVNHIYTTDELKPTISLRYNYMPALPSLDAESSTSSVGDNINLFDKDNVKITHKLTQNDNKFVTNTNSNFITINADGSSNAVYENNLKAGDYSISFDIISTKNITLENFYLVTKKSDDTMRNVVVIKSVSLKANEKTRVSGSNKLDSDAIKYGFAGYFKPNFENGTVTISNIKLEKGTIPTPWSPYGQGCIQLIKNNENLFFKDKTERPIGNVSGYVATEYIPAKTGDTITKSNKTQLFFYNYKKEQVGYVAGWTTGIIKIKDVSYIRCNLLETEINTFMLVKNRQLPAQYIEGNRDTKTLYVQKAFIAHDNVTDFFTKQEDKWYEQHNIEKIVFDGTQNIYKGQPATGTDTNTLYVAFAYKNSSLVNTEINCMSENLKAYTASFLYANDVEGITQSPTQIIFRISKERASTIEEAKILLANEPITVYVRRATPELIPCTAQQSTILDQLENIQLYDGVNYIYTTDGIQPLFALELYNMIEDYDLYVSNDGYFGIPGTDIKFLVNFHESNLPTMPEAVEASVRAAGRDGDYVLNTTYEPLPFEIVCYTEDNLTVTQKREIESKVNRFLNSIKNRTKKIAFEKGEKFYNVKYNGLLTTTNYPAHLKFSIPLKSSESFGKDAYQKVLSGNSTEVSDTVEEVGALITIYGPATLPIIALNDYSMEYDTAILEGARVEIDTAKSTATHINSDGVKTNVMRHYNHQFPKIQPGENTLKVLSGVDDENNVTVKWNDLKL